MLVGGGVSEKEDDEVADDVESNEEVAQPNGNEVERRDNREELFSYSNCTSVVGESVALLGSGRVMLDFETNEGVMENLL